MNRVNKKTQIVKYLSSFNWLWIVITMAVFAGLIKLSFWQYSRGIEKQQRVARIEQLGQQQAISLSALLNQNSLEDDQTINDILVTINGYFVEPYVFLLDNQVDNGQPGYKVLAVFLDAISNQYVLLNLGWVKGSVDRRYLPDITLPKGEHTLTARVRFISNTIMLSSDNFQAIDWPLRIQQINSQEFSQLINKPLLPFTLILDKKESIGYKKSWQPIVMPAEKHFGYAVQWGGLALAWLTLMIIASYRAFKRQQDGSVPSVEQK
ncbi:SURF1 family protein [Thalassotalea ponticola]|uniref:SURF1 family protein n=1 Tax=Thalassotalea ponticola TaxID=1523392 RepID=UPI0025B53039|nr:SURF1 family protein [Thalassotalea ponticola]MDN3652285.1 SURF1 family protein [Thalassotalea ponticola]